MGDCDKQYNLSWVGNNEVIIICIKIMINQTYGGNITWKERINYKLNFVVIKFCVKPIEILMRRAVQSISDDKEFFAEKQVVLSGVLLGKKRGLDI